MDEYYTKYLKYKIKYNHLKNIIGGNYNILKIDEEPTDIQFLEFEKILQSREQNWLVFYSGFHTDSEKIRFNNTNWVFYDWSVFESRVSIKGTINLENIKKLSDKFPNSFDYICFDWRFDNMITSDADFMSLINNLLKLLKIGGKICINNYNNLIDKDSEDNTIKITKIKSVGTPLGEGAGGDNLISKIFRLINKSKDIYNLIFDDTHYNFIRLLKSKLFRGIDETLINTFYDNLCYIRSVIETSRCESFKNNYINVMNELQINSDFSEGLQNDFNNLLINTTALWRLPHISDKYINELQNIYLLIEKKTE